MMSLDEFKRVVDSLKGYPSMVGIIGGEPLLVPWIADCFRYLRSAFPREQLGLWSVFPQGEKYVALREVICETFSNILLNDHSVGNIMHAPMLVASGEYFDNVEDLYIAADKCWVANRWSPSVTDKGGFFCEVAAELDQLFDGPGGWELKPGWWKKTPKDYTEQIERWCSKCGGCLPLQRKSSQDEVCDISEGNFEALKGISKKVDRGDVVVHKKGEFKFDKTVLQNGGYPDQSPYKDEIYRKGIAARYGIDLILNSRGYWEPILMQGDWRNRKPVEPIAAAPPLYQIMKDRYSGEVAG